MALSDTSRRILAEAAQHPLRLAAPPDKLPTAACWAMLTNLLKQGYVEEFEAPDEFTGLRWHQQDGTRPTVRITEADMAAIDAAPAATATLPDTEGAGAGTERARPPEEPGSAPLAAPAIPEALVVVAPTPAEAAQPPSTAPSTCASLRDAAQRVLAAWQDETNGRAGLSDAMAVLRAILVKPTPAARTAGPRKPREGTKQQQVLAMLSQGSYTIYQVQDAG